MKATDKSIIAIGAVLLLALAFWFMILAPKRSKSSELNDQVTQLESSVEQQESIASFAEAARKDFPKYYGRLVVLGKAVPDEADSASLIVQLSDIARDSDVTFRALELGDGAGATAQPAAPAEPPPPAETASEPSTSDVSSTTTTTPTTPAPATEASAATLPIGSTVGPAGLGVLSYNLTFAGNFFNTADFLAGVDKMINLKDSGQVAADGRLMTIDGFSLIGDPGVGFPKLEASFVMSAYSTPTSQGLTLGASPTAPAPATEAVPTSTVSAP